MRVAERVRVPSPCPAMSLAPDSPATINTVAKRNRRTNTRSCGGGNRDKHSPAAKTEKKQFHRRKLSARQRASAPVACGPPAHARLAQEPPPL